MIDSKEATLMYKFLIMKDRIQLWSEAQIELEKLQIEQKELSRKADRLHKMVQIAVGIILGASVFSLLFQF